MPLQRGYTSRDGERAGWYRWGDGGKKYYYEPGNPDSRNAAKGLAESQGRAIEASKRS
jgi:hypothetical protein